MRGVHRGTGAVGVVSERQRTGEALPYGEMTDAQCCETGYHRRADNEACACGYKQGAPRRESPQGFVGMQIEGEHGVLVLVSKRRWDELERLRGVLEEIAGCHTSMTDQCPYWAQWALEGKDTNGRPVESSSDHQEKK